MPDLPIAEGADSSDDDDTGISEMWTFLHPHPLQYGRYRFLSEASVQASGSCFEEVSLETVAGLSTAVGPIVVLRDLLYLADPLQLQHASH